MNSYLRLVLSPTFPIELLVGLLIVVVIVIFIAVMRRTRGALMRALACTLFLLAIADPSLLEEQRSPLKDTVLVITDESASMRLGDRAEQATKAADVMEKKLAQFPDLDIQTLHIKGATETDLFRALDNKLASIARDRFAGAIVITDGEVHDRLENAASLPGPIHMLVAGHRKDMDRRLVVVEAPAYGIVGKNVVLKLRVEDHPKAQSEHATLHFRRGDGSGDSLTVPIGKDVTFEAPVDHAGSNLLVFSTEELPNELTNINNSVAVSVNGIRDRLRVLLVSGEPHIGGRTWRNFLKADPAVDLIHFTILRSPNKMDGVPNSELSLIAFPVHELFDRKLSSFDLVIFDRFRRESLISEEYLENIARYVEHGGALLISNATDENIPTLTLSPLARILPAEPTGHVLTGSFVPDVTQEGNRHPVTSSLTHDMPRDQWGEWYRQTEARARKGVVLMNGMNNAPLLVLDRVGDGRVAQFLSDQFWLWSREAPRADKRNGGPQADLLRRTAHWLVGEPELDETALRARAEATEDGWRLTITRQSLDEKSRAVTLTDPNNAVTQLQLMPSKEAGVLSASQAVTLSGIYRLTETMDDGSQREVLVMAGISDAPEFKDMIATEDLLKPTIIGSHGGINWLEDSPNGPEIKRTGKNGAQSGGGWIGLKKNDQYRVTGSKAWPLWPAWLAALVLLIASMAAWRREGK